MIQTKFVEERARLDQLQETYKERIGAVYEKMTSIMLHRCYRSLPPDVAKKVISSVKSSGSS